jgi:hypothetical protein
MVYTCINRILGVATRNTTKRTSKLRELELLIRTCAPSKKTSPVCSKWWTIPLGLFTHIKKFLSSSPGCKTRWRGFMCLRKKNGNASARASGRPCLCSVSRVPRRGPRRLEHPERHLPPLVRVPNRHRKKEETPKRGSRRREGTCNTRSTFETSRCYTCTIRLKTDEKHLQKHVKTLETIVKHTQHPDKTLATYMWNICNI